MKHREPRGQAEEKKNAKRIKKKSNINKMDQGQDKTKQQMEEKDQE